MHYVLTFPKTIPAKKNSAKPLTVNVNTGDMPRFPI